MPLRVKQTNNRAELYAVIKAIDKATGKVAIVTDYESAYKGVIIGLINGGRMGGSHPRAQSKTLMFG